MFKGFIFTALSAGILVLPGCLGASGSTGAPADKPCYGGVYPHLAYYNDEGECGTGAVVPWQGRLWVITYGPHLPWGSSDRLYEIDDTLGIVTRPESIGGTPADRMIHRESGQLIIGPYFIDSLCNVRALSYTDAQGRYTGVARHLDDPANKVYIATMEEGFYEVDVNTLAHSELYPDANGGEHDDTHVNPPNNLLPGAHGKGLYSGQGVLVFANNGEAVPEALEKFNIPSGCLAEWDGKDWTVVRRNQFTEVTGPGGIYGSDTDAPVYSLGWDYKSIILAMRDGGEWSFYRLPKASHSYDGAHGWNTEWPRIREVGTAGKPFKLMTMHGMFWQFPDTFDTAHARGIRPLSAYLKVIGDFTRWGDRLVMGCDDSARKEFLNTRRIKGGIAGPGQSNSNLWFVDPDDIASLGPDNASGALWLDEPVKAGEPSDPMLFASWPRRCAWVSNNGDKAVTLKFEVSDIPSGEWNRIGEVPLAPGESSFVPFDPGAAGEWIRVVSDKDSRASVILSYADNDDRPTTPDAIFDGMADIDDIRGSEGLLYCLGDNVRRMGVSSPSGYYELDARMTLARCDNPVNDDFIRKNLAISCHGLDVTDGSALIVDDKGRRWRLPLGPEAFSRATCDSMLRVCREVATERDLLNLLGTFYELPAENADGFAKIRPISSHRFNINDYASYRGMLIMTGLADSADTGNRCGRVVKSDDGRMALWAGVIDDLWKLGKPTGSGGPWVDTAVATGEPSDPYLIGFYDDRTLNLSHKSSKPVTFTVEADPTGEGHWMHYADFKVAPGDSFIHEFPEAFQARWIRFKTDTPCVATTWLEYK